jgi:hypothetical protein
MIIPYFKEFVNSRIWTVKGGSVAFFIILTRVLMRDIIKLTKERMVLE